MTVAGLATSIRPTLLSRSAVHTPDATLFTHIRKMHHPNALVLGFLLAASASATVANAAGQQKTKLRNAREDLTMQQQDNDNEEPLQLRTNRPRYLGRRSLVHETAAGAPTAAPTEWQLSEDWWTDSNPPPDNSQGSYGGYRTTPSTATSGGGGGAIDGCQKCLQQYPYFQLETAHLCKATCYQYAPTPTGGGNQRPPSAAASNGNVAGTTNSDPYRDSRADYGTASNAYCMECKKIYPQQTETMCHQYCDDEAAGGGSYRGSYHEPSTWNWHWPTSSPTPSPTQSLAPSSMPSGTPSCVPSSFPSVAPSRYPSAHPSRTPSRFPSSAPSRYPSAVSFKFSIGRHGSCFCYARMYALHTVVVLTH